MFVISTLRQNQYRYKFLNRITFWWQNRVFLCLGVRSSDSDLALLQLQGPFLPSCATWQLQLLLLLLPFARIGLRAVEIATVRPTQEIRR